MSNPNEDGPVPNAPGEPNPTPAADGMQEYRRQQLAITIERQRELGMPDPLPLPKQRGDQ